MAQDNTMKNRVVFLLGSLAYFAWFYFLVGFRAEHAVLYVVLAGFYVANGAGRRFVLAFAAFFLYWMIYDSMRIAPNYTINPIHVLEPYQIEKAWFGITGPGGQRITPNEYFAQHASAFFNVLTGLFYISWIPVPVIFGYWLFRNNKPLFVHFSYAFFFINLLGFLVYYLYPAAPPWYVEQYGFEVHTQTPGNAAGLLNFDAFFGIHLFASMYQKNASIFAAIPSMHSAFPVLCLLYGRHLHNKWLNAGFSVLVAGIWFAAVYTRHHYIIDVLAGGAVAVFGYLVFEYLASKTRVKNWLDALLERI